MSVAADTASPAGTSVPHDGPRQDRQLPVLWLRRGAWWLHPAWAVVLACLPGLLLTVVIPSSGFERLWGVRKYFGTPHLTLALMLLVVFAVCSLAPRALRRAEPPGERHVTVTEGQARIVRRAAALMPPLVVTGYALWWTVALSRGLGDALATGAVMRDGEFTTVKQALVPVPGASHLAHLGSLTVIVLLLDRRLSGRPHRLALAAVFGCALVRSLLYAERLAVIELLVPVVVFAALFGGRRRGADHVDGRGRRALWASVPLAAPVALLSLFSMFEYFRSWRAHVVENEGGYLSYMLVRLGGYYATSFNNSAILLDHLAPMLQAPYFTVRSLWGFADLVPFPSALRPMGDLDPQQEWQNALLVYGNGAFNSEGGLLAPAADFGAPGALVWAAVMGAAWGLLYTRVQSGSLGAVLPYCVLYIGLIDLTRHQYWGEGLAVVPLVVGTALAVALGRAASAPAR